jgi:hypothetical protein
LKKSARSKKKSFLLIILNEKSSGELKKIVFPIDLSISAEQMDLGESQSGNNYVRN